MLVTVQIFQLEYFKNIRIHHEARVRLHVSEWRAPKPFQSINLSYAIGETKSYFYHNVFVGHNNKFILRVPFVT
jgi:hypothetical protein